MLFHLVVVWMGFSAASLTDEVKKQREALENVQEWNEQLREKMKGIGEVGERMREKVEAHKRKFQHVGAGGAKHGFTELMRRVQHVIDEHKLNNKNDDQDNTREDEL